MEASSRTHNRGFGERPGEVRQAYDTSGRGNVNWKEMPPEDNWAKSAGCRGPLERNVAVLLAGIGVLLVFKGTQSRDDTRASFGGFDDRIDVTAFRGDERIGEALAEFLNLLLAKLFAFGFRGFVQVAFIDDVNGAFRAHDGNFRVGPCEIRVRANVF